MSDRGRELQSDLINVSICNYYEELCAGKRFFLMPSYQRPYSWEKKQIEDFWNDLTFAVEESGDFPYLFGSIYLAEIKYSSLYEHVNPDILTHEMLSGIDRESIFYFVIDGQQRTTTFFLFLLAFKNKEIKADLFIDYLPRILPGKTDFEYFVRLVKGDDKKPGTASNRRLKETYNYFLDKLNDFPKKEMLRVFVLEKLHIVKIRIENNFELAGTLFVSQTDRGKRLTNLEKLKSSLLFYTMKVSRDSREGQSIDNLFGGFFEIIESLCSMKIYSKPENAEADVLRILNFMLLRENFYNQFLNSLIKDESDKGRKIDIWHDSGEDRIYEAISKVLRESLSIKKENIREIILYLKDRLKTILSLFRYIVEKGVPFEQQLAYPDPYSGKAWYPFRQLFSILGLSVFSKAMLAVFHDQISQNGLSNLDPGFFMPKINELKNIKLFEDIDRIKAVHAKLSTIETDPDNFGDIRHIHKYPEVFAFIKNFYRIVLRRIDHYRTFLNKPVTIFNLIEENELGIWKIGKRPVGSFIWESNDADAIIDHVRRFSFGYKKEYLVRDLGYSNFKYVLFEYERIVFDYSEEEISRVFNYDIDEDDGVLIQREHIMAQSPLNYKELKDIWLSSTNENYEDWIWKIGNIVLLEHDKNIGSSNKAVWEKAEYYSQSAFKGAVELANTINQLKEIIDRSIVNVSLEEKPYIINLPYKILFEIREMELLSFVFCRFS